MVNSILCICTGNVCRSPMAEWYLKHHFTSMNKNVHVSSAGIGALVGNAAVSEAIQVLSNKGIDISRHRARQINQNIALRADLILAMDKEHKQYVERKFPQARGRVFLLGKWQGDQEIFDPFQQSLNVFEEAFALIEQGCQAWIKRLF